MTLNSLYTFFVLLLFFFMLAIKAVAYSLVIEPDPIKFRVDHPFKFAIVEGPYILFVGHKTNQ